MENDFQYRLQKAIAAKGITASELSRLSGVNKVAISNYINGVYVAKQDKCYLLAKALDVDPGWLMTGEEPISIPEDRGPVVSPQTPEARILARGIDKLPQAQREQALAVVRAMFTAYADYFESKETDHDSQL